MSMMPQPKSRRRFIILSRIVWSISFIITAFLIIDSMMACAKIMASNLFDWRPFELPIPPVESNHSGGQDLLWWLIFLFILFVNFILSIIYAFLAKKSNRASAIRAFVPLALNLVVLLLATTSSDWDIPLDLQTNWKRQDVVQMLEKREVRSTIIKSVAYSEGNAYSDTYLRDVIRSPNQNFRVLIEFTPTYQHLVREHDSLKVIRQDNVLSVYFPLSESEFYGTTFKGLLYQSKDTEPKMFGGEQLHDVKRLREHWYQVYYEHPFN